MLVDTQKQLVSPRGTYPTAPGVATTPGSGADFFCIEGIHRGRGAPIPGGQTERWILCEGPHVDGEVELFDELCWRLLGDGIPLWRANLHVGTLHPQTRGFGLRWWRERNVIEEYRVLHGAELTEDYFYSPIRGAIPRCAAVSTRIRLNTRCCEESGRLAAPAISPSR